MHGRDIDRYIARAASDWDAPDPWQVVDGSLVFVDISGFTNLSERLSAFGRIGTEELTEVLSRVFGSMLDLAYARGGSLLKFGGDALLLLFSGEDHAVQAACAAIDMRGALRAIRGTPTSAGPLRLNLSIGAHSGSIHLFLVGESHRELVVAGSGATRTTEMEKTASGGEIVVSPETRAALPAGAAVDPRGDGWLLRWRRPPVAGTGPIRRAAEAGVTTDLLLPTALRAHLADGHVEPEHRIANIGFIRFSGLDAILRESGLAGGWAALDQLVRTVQAAADAEGVTFLASDIDADGGKVILATGVPTMSEDGGGRLLRAARRIVETPGLLDVRVGINRGHVYAGEVGTEYRCTYTVMGDSVNLAARLMAAAPARTLYAAPAVLDDARSLFATTALEPFSVKGKAEPVHAYAVGDEVDDRHGERSGEASFHGRAAELAAVTATLRGAEADVDRVLTVVGPEGIGKSRLVEEALGLDPEQRSLVVRGEPYGAEVAYRALRYPMRRLLGLGELLTSAELPDAFLQAVKAVDPALAPYLPLLADVVHLQVDPTPEASALDARFRRQRTVEVVEELLGHLLGSPAAIVVDDAHWLDEASAELLEALASTAPARGWGMVVLRRDEAGGFSPTGARRIDLEPFDVGDARSLVASVTAAAPLRPNDVAAIVDRAGGNPLYLLELVRAVRSTGIDDLPASLDATVAIQIDRLPAAARRVLRLAAVLGRSFPRRVLDEILAQEQLAFDRPTAAQLEDFLEPEGRTQLSFRHALLQEVAYAELPYRRRREVHAMAGEAIERLNADDPDRAADVLGLHFERAHRHAEAWRYAPVAGDAAARAYANAEAATHYVRALAATRWLDEVDDAARADMWARLGDVRVRAGEFDLALEAYRRAVRLSRGDPQTEASMLLRRARARERAGSFSSALVDITGGLRLLSADDPTADALRARLLTFRAVVRQAQGRMTQAHAIATLSADLAARCGEERSLASSYAVMDWVQLATGHLDGVSHGEEARRIYERIGDLEGQGQVANTMGAAAYYRGNWDEAVTWYEEARDLAVRVGNHVQAAISAMNIAEIHVNERRFDQAEELLTAAISVFAATGLRDGLAMAETYLGRSRLGSGDLAGAQEVLRRAQSEFDAVGSPSGALEPATHLADAMVQAGDPAGALAALDAAVSRTGGDCGVLAPAVARVRASALFALGDHEGASIELRVGLDFARTQQLAYEERLLLDLGGELEIAVSSSV